jgi:ureidoacrylate peracid hydrolase
MRPAHIRARPDPLDLDLDRTALIVVDMQNDFGAPGGMFDRAGIDIAPIRAIVPRIAAVLAEARAAAMPIVYLKMQFEPDLSDAGAERTPNRIKHRPMGLGDTVAIPGGGTGGILVRDTWNTEIVPDLAPLPGDVVIAKHRFSGFFKTGLDAHLQSAGIESLIFTGATTSICVDSTVRDAMFRDYVCVVLEDCVAEPIAHDASRSNHEATLLAVQLLLGWVSTAADLAAALRDRPGSGASGAGRLIGSAAGR